MSGDTVTGAGAFAVEMAEFAGRLAVARRRNIGFPGATDFDHTVLSDLLCGHLLNNVGDPHADGDVVNQSKVYEREVVGFLAGLFRADHDFWGYVTSGGSEGNLYGLYMARRLYPDAMVYVAATAHYSVFSALDLLGMGRVVIAADPATGVLDYADLADQIARRRDQAAVLVATAGTTLHEALDDLRQITRILDDLAVVRRYVHVDAALSGVPLALLDPDGRPGFDFADGADSITVSGHKFLAVPQPCGVFLTRAGHRARVARTVGYPARPDATLLGSRSGHTPLMLAHTIRTHGVDGLRARAQAARELAAHVHDRLAELGWAPVRHPHAFTVSFPSPPAAVSKEWVLASTHGRSHVITMPGVTRETVDEFLTTMAALPAPNARPDHDQVPDEGGGRMLRLPIQREPAGVSA